MPKFVVRAMLFLKVLRAADPTKEWEKFCTSSTGWSRVGHDSESAESSLTLGRELKGRAALSRAVNRMQKPYGTAGKPCPFKTLAAGVCCVGPSAGSADKSKPISVGLRALRSH